MLTTRFAAIFGLVLFTAFGCGGKGIVDPPPPPPTVSVALAASPASGQAPLSGVDLSATVGGTAAGDIQYRFDCTNDGAFDVDVSSSQGSYAAVDACSYPAAGTYTARVSVERQGVSAQHTVAVTVSETPAPTLIQVILTPEYASLLTGETQQFTVAGRMSDGSETSVDAAYTATGGTITASGIYTAGATTGRYQVIAVQKGGTLADTAMVVVNTPPPPPTLSVALAASPASGTAPLSGVDFAVSVSGTATGPVEYLLDCTSDGTDEVNLTGAPPQYTLWDACSYPNAGSYTARVRTLRQGITAEATAQITVSEPPPPPPPLGVAISFCLQNGPCYGDGSVLPLNPDIRYDFAAQGRTNRGFASLYYYPLWEASADGTPGFALALIEDPFIGPSPLANGSAQISGHTFTVREGRGVLQGALFAPDTVITGEICIGIVLSADCPENAIETGGGISVELIIRDRSGNVIPDLGTVTYDPTQCNNQGCYTAHVRVTSTRGLRAMYYAHADRGCNVSGTPGCRAFAELFSHFSNRYVPGAAETMDITVVVSDTDRAVFEVRADDGVTSVTKRVHVYVQH